MLTLKIRVPYKIGSTKNVLNNRIAPYLTGEAVVEGYQIVNDAIQLYIFNGKSDNETLDLRLLED